MHLILDFTGMVAVNSSFLRLSSNETVLGLLCSFIRYPTVVRSGKKEPVVGLIRIFEAVGQVAIIMPFTSNIK